jgi:hypothetical protein
MKTTMTKEFKLNPALCVWDDFRPYLPAHDKELTLAQWLKRSREGSFAPYAKFSGERSTPFWKKNEVAASFLHLYGKSYPASVTALHEAGFRFAKPKGDFTQPKTRKSKKTKKTTEANGFPRLGAGKKKRSRRD